MEPTDGEATGLSPSERTTRARIAAHTRWSKTTDRTAATAAARSRFNQRFEDEVDIDRKLDPELRAKLAANARKAFYQRLAYRSARARRARRNTSTDEPRPIAESLSELLDGLAGPCSEPER